MDDTENSVHRIIHLYLINYWYFWHWRKPSPDLFYWTCVELIIYSNKIMENNPPHPPICRDLSSRVQMDAYLKHTTKLIFQHGLITKMFPGVHFWEPSNMFLQVHVSAFNMWNKCYGAVLLTSSLRIFFCQDWLAKDSRWLFSSSLPLKTLLGLGKENQLGLRKGTNGSVYIQLIYYTLIFAVMAHMRKLAPVTYLRLSKIVTTPSSGFVKT